MKLHAHDLYNSTAFRRLCLIYLSYCVFSEISFLDTFSRLPQLCMDIMQVGSLGLTQCSSKHSFDKISFVTTGASGTIGISILQLRLPILKPIRVFRSSTCCIGFFLRSSQSILILFHRAIIISVLQVNARIGSKEVREDNKM